MKSNSEARFGLGAWLILVIAIGAIIIAGIDVAHRFSLPTDGWEIGEEGDVTFLRDLAGINPSLEMGDRLVAIEGVPADHQAFGESMVLQTRWKAGSVLDYTILRAKEKLDVPVLLGNWPDGAGFWETFMRPIKLLGLAVALIQFGLAAFIFLRRPGNPAAGSFFLIMVIFAGITISEIVPFSYSNWIDPFASFLQSSVIWIFLVVLMPITLLRFALTFPRPKSIHLRYPWLSTAAGGVGIGLLVFASKSDLGWFWFVISLLLAIGILIHNAFTMRDATSRAQIRWGIGGFVIGFGTLTTLLLLNTTGIVSISTEIFDLFIPLTMLVMVAMIAVAISRYRLFDIDIIIRRTLQYTILTGLLVLLYFGGIIILQRLLGPLIGDFNSPLFIVITTLAIAALFNPLRVRVQEFIDLRFFRKKYDAQKALNKFAVIARDEVDIERLTQVLLGLIDETMQPDQSSLWLREASPRGRGKE